jgi:hypothetical protein
MQDRERLESELHDARVAIAFLAVLVVVLLVLFAR